MSPSRFATLDGLLDTLAGRTILVIGDLMIDQFVIGTVERISPEAPVPIVRFDHETWRLGGAANVANNIVALGGSVEAIGVVGNDADGGRLLEDLSGRSIGTGGIISDASRCTTRKLRVVTTRNQQVARIDYEGDSEIAAERGLPALALWCWFVATLLIDFLRLRKTSSLPSIAASGIACVVAMIAAGMFEYNFGDSEFLMLFLVLVTLPYAAERVPALTAERKAA